MAIKIKNKQKREPEDTEQEGGSGVPPAQAPGSGLDGFERASFMAAAWIEDNRGLFFALIGVVVVAILGIVIGVYYVRGQQVEASNRLSEGLAAYEVPVEGSPELEAIRAQEGIPELPRTFDTSEEKWEVVYGSAEHTLADFDRGPIAMTARMVKAAAAMNLGDYDESAQLYRQVIDSGEANREIEANAHMGLANSLAAEGDMEGAEAAWDRFAELLPDRRAYAQFEVARLIERHGDPDEARQRYEQFLNDYPDSDYADEVERRHALL